jgi:hypothetical protein
MSTTKEHVRQGFYIDYGRPWGCRAYDTPEERHAAEDLQRPNSFAPMPLPRCGPTPLA